MDEKELLEIVEETRELTKDNNRILHSIQRRDRMALIMKSIYWIVILGITIGAFYFLQPYIDSAKEAYNSIVDTQHKISETSKSFSFESFKNYFK